METSTPTFLIKKILFDHLPDKIALIEKVIDENGFGNTVEQIIANVSELLHPTGKAETNPQEIAAYAYKAIKEINQQVIKIEDPEARNEVKGLLSDFFNAVIKEISLKKPTLSEQINKEITNGLRIAAKIEGYDEVDLFNHIKLDDLNFLADFPEAIERTRSDKIEPTRFKTILTRRELRTLGELLQQYGIARRKDQFGNLFSSSKKTLVPVTCTNEKQLHFIHFMYCLVMDLKWVSVENAGDWDGIKECFVDQDKNVFGKKIKQYYHREIKKPETNTLIITDVDAIFNDFYQQFPDRKRTQDGLPQNFRHKRVG